MSELNATLQLVPEANPRTLRPLQKFGLALFATGLLLVVVMTMNGETSLGIAGFAMGIVGALIHIIDMRKDGPPGIKNNYIMFGSESARGAIGWMIGIFLTGFYVLLYFWPEYLRNLIAFIEPVQVALSGESGITIVEKEVNGAIVKEEQVSQWFLYGFLYTIAVLIMGLRAIIKYRHSRYQIIRTLSVMFFQLAFAFMIPNILYKLNQPYYDWTSIWPLRYYELFPWSVNSLVDSGAVGRFMVFWGVISILVITPILTYFFGKRWYCSWVCGCGGLAETLGDPFRQNSDKSLRAWKIERWMIHSVLIFIVVTTGLLWLDNIKSGTLLGGYSHKFSSAYGFLIGAIFSGVIGTGFYPIMGSRVWCRFGCPMAAILGILQRHFSRFRITTNGSQCISCGNCSTYCEMGIDVRSYAQRGENIVRASCVGCGVCSAVCPRGVLNLENGPTGDRFSFPV